MARYSPATRSSHVNEDGAQDEARDNRDGIELIGEHPGTANSPHRGSSIPVFKIEHLEKTELPPVKSEPLEDPLEVIAPNIDEPGVKAAAPVRGRRVEDDEKEERTQRELSALKDRFAALEALLREHLHVNIGVEKHAAEENESTTSKRARSLVQSNCCSH
ncbi:hypothetical protein CALCODRAFT_497906 [Calocera cornea HHB12733]|uniref:Uncharacterized protein n=1 Tax=Calocera cornea HHB12733 TaxID=1353952 RepID=A0A165F1E2_9BASI|nr:hypothetical protein CALCODRAFT_497906 [Calocera cornea HHB12733]